MRNSGCVGAARLFFGTGGNGMKRIKAACICQTLHFMLKDGVGHDDAVKQVEQEVEQYKKNLERKHIKHKIVAQSKEQDGSITLKVIKQYNSSPVGSYLDEA